MELSLNPSNENINDKSFFINCINNNPNDIDAYLHLADLLCEEKKYDKAIEVLDKALLIFRDDKSILETKLGILLDAGMHDDARIVINKLLSFDVISPYTYNNNGFLLSIEGKHKEAIESYKHALALDNKDTSFMTNIAISYKAIYEYDKAIEMLESAYKIKPSKSTKYLLDSAKQNKEDSTFSYDTLVEFLANPNRFHLLIPKDFNAQIINNILTITSENNKISIIISYDNTKYNNKKIEDEFNKYLLGFESIYSIIKPLSIVERKLYNDTLSSSMFISKINKSHIFNAFAVVNKNDEALIMTISSNIFISSKLIELASRIISSLYFRGV